MNNIAPKEAVEVIKKYRVDGKKKYIQNKVTDDASGLKEVKEKPIELEEINTTASSDIKWEHIRTEVLKRIIDDATLPILIEFWFDYLLKGSFKLLRY
ncbi:unnamed protein product [Rhizophagus irregularis]|nr:unnamed protein product [Rhizophagus irregularis]